MQTFITFVALFACAVLGALVWRLYRHNRALRTRADESAASLEHTSHALIQKNLELNDQNTRQQQLLEAREDFLNIVSHQLRTPVTELGWGLDGILKDDDWKLSPAQRTYIETLSLSARHLVHLINDILRLVHIEQTYDRSVVTPYDPDAAMREIAEGIAEDFATKNIRCSFNLQFGGTIDSIDSESLGMAVSNLVENAFFYTKDGGEITLASEKHGTGEITVSVKDTGIGIRAEDQHDVFMKFRRTPLAIKMNARGSGLGLYIVKNIIERHGGSVGFSSEEGTGTTFFFTLPIARASKGV